MSWVRWCAIVELDRSGGPLVEALEPRQLLSAFQADINFQPASVAVPAGYDADSGAAFGLRDNGLTYGWDVNRSGAVSQNKPAIKHGGDVLSDTFATINHTGRGSLWEIAVPDGTYAVEVVAGNPSAAHAFYSIEAEGVSVLSGKATPAQKWIEGTATVTVTDGLLALTAGPKAGGTWIDFVDIQQQVLAADPAAAASPPANVSPPPASPSPPVTVSPPASIEPPPASPPPAPNAPITWTQEASAPVAMAEGQGTTINGEAYVFGGYSITEPSWQAENQLNVYNPATNSWKGLASVPQRLSEAAVTTDGVDLYVAGGYITNANGQQTFATSNVWKYDPATNTWSAFVSLPAPRGVGAMVYLDGELHYFGGSNLSRTDCTEQWVLNLNSSDPQWANAAPLPQGVNRLGAAVVDGEIYAVGGQTGYDNNAIPTAVAYVWNPANPSTWTAIAPMPEPHSHLGAAVVAIDGQLVVVGGDEAVGDFLANVVAYDPATNSWTELTPLPAPRLATLAAVIGDQILVTDGYNNGAMSSTTWVSDPLEF